MLNNFLFNFTIKTRFLIFFCLQNLHIKLKVKEAEREIITIGHAQVSFYTHKCFLFI